jgi:peptidoglycan/LPS O-acetylase OafA/YrhL
MSILSAPAGNRPHVAALDGLRGMAVLLVLAGHSSKAYLEPSTQADFPLLAALLGCDSLGVRLFFILSGYLITWLLMGELQQTGGLNLKAFYLRRGARILPAYWFFLACLALFARAGLVDVSWQQFLNALFFLWNYAPLWHVHESQEGAWYLGHLWSLAVEIQFYLVWPLLLWKMGPARAKWICLLAAASMPPLRLSSYLLFPEQRGLLGIMFHTSLDGLMLGSAVALWNRQLPENFNHLLRKSSSLAAALVFVLIFSPLLAHSLRGYQVTAGYFLEALAGAVLLKHALEGGAWTAFLSKPWIVFAGAISYGLYLWQQLFLTEWNTSWTGDLPWSLAAGVVMAVLSWRVIEQPARRFAHQRLKGRTKPARPADPTP